MIRARALGLFTIVFLLSSCSENKSTPIAGALNYFDIKGYFAKEASRLSEKNNIIYKEILKDNKKEAKNIRIKDWMKEFSLFTESDINKPSWASSYSLKNNIDTLIYSSLDPGLRTKEIKILKEEDQLLFLSIRNETINKLYRSEEELLYIPDSCYKIIKKQEVRIIGQNDYQVTGTFIK